MDLVIALIQFPPFGGLLLAELLIALVLIRVTGGISNETSV